jgi:hypothetical protein
LRDAFRIADWVSTVEQRAHSRSAQPKTALFLWGFRRFRFRSAARGSFLERRAAMRLPQAGFQ